MANIQNYLNQGFKYQNMKFDQNKQSLNTFENNGKTAKGCSGKSNVS